MAEFGEVIKQFNRMCHRENCATTTGCPMYPSCNIGQCRKIAFERQAEFETRVIKWAADHPEPNYPTWYEWLRDMGAWNYLGDHMPPDIAQKFGVKPKEE